MDRFAFFGQVESFFAAIHLRCEFVALNSCGEIGLARVLLQMIAIELVQIRRTYRSGRCLSNAGADRDSNRRFIGRMTVP